MSVVPFFYGDGNGGARRAFRGWGSVSGLIGVMGYAVSSELVEGKLADLGDEHRVLVAEDHQRIVGWAPVYIDRTLYGPAVAQLGGLAVHPEETRRGVGGASLDVVEGWASERGCVAVWVRSGEQRAPAHRFYRARGYQDLKRHVVLVKPLADHIADPRRVLDIGSRCGRRV